MLFVFAVLSYLGITAECLMQEPVVVCSLNFTSSFLPSKTPCTHIVYGSYQMRPDNGFLRLQNSLPLGLKALKEENPNSKFLPYFTSLSQCPEYYGHTLGPLYWQDPTIVDGVAFSMDNLSACREDSIKKILKSISTSNVSIAYTTSSSLGAFKSVLKRLPSQLKIVVWNNTVAWKMDHTDELKSHQNIVAPFSLKGRLVVESNKTFFNWENTENRQVSYTDVCKTIIEDNILPEWDNNTYSPYIKLSEGKVYFENEESASYKAQLALNKGFGGVNIDLSEDDSAEACGKPYPLITAIRKQYFYGSPIELFLNKNDVKGNSQMFEETIAYCMWKDTMVGSSKWSLKMESIASCSFVGFQPKLPEDIAVLESLMKLPASNPLVKLVLVVNIRYIFWDSLEKESLANFMRYYKLRGLDIILDEDISEENLQQAVRILKEIKAQNFEEKMFLFLTIKNGGKSLYKYNATNNLTEIVDFVNLAHFYGNDSDTVSHPISAAPLTSSFDDKSIVFSISHAIYHGIPRNKIIFGVPNFAYLYNMDDKTLSEISHQMVCEIMENTNHSQNWDTFAAVPFLTFSDNYVTYENSTSILMKLDLVSKQGIRGVSVYWIDAEDCDQISSDKKTVSSQIRDFIVLKNNRHWFCPAKTTG